MWQRSLPSLLFLLLFSSSVLAQPVAYPGLARKVRNGTTLPTTCTVGDAFMDTDATSGQRFYLCESANTWTLQGDGAGGGSGDVTDVGDCDGPACFTGTEGNTLTFKGATSGTTALKPTAVAGTTTITMPAETGTMCTTGSVCSGYAPSSADYVTGSAQSGLSAEQSLGTLTTGLLLNTVAASTGTVSAYGGTSCTNQFPRSLNASGAATCASVASTDIASMTSSAFAGIISDETGTAGKVVFDTSPVFATSIAIPQGTGPTVDAAGEIAVDTTSDQLIYYGGAAGILTDDYTLCKTLESPVETDDNIPLWNFKRAVSITDVYCEVDGGTSISMTLSDGTNALEAITCDGDGAEDDGSIANGTFTARERIEMDLASPSGTNTWLVVCVTFETTAD